MSLQVEDLTTRSNEYLRALPLQPFPMLALWLLRDARTPERLLANLAHWLDALALLLEKQLTLEFGDIPPAYRTQLEQATHEQIDRYAARVLTADTLAAVFAE